MIPSPSDLRLNFYKIFVFEFGDCALVSFIMTRDISFISPPPVLCSHIISRNVWPYPNPPLVCQALYNIGYGNIV